MVELTESPALVPYGQVLDDDNAIGVEKKTQLFMLLFGSGDDADDGAPVRKENLTKYSIFHQLLEEIEEALNIQAKSEPKWAKGAIDRATFGCVLVPREAIFQKRPDMANVRRLMFEKNIATSYVAGGELEVPETVWRALGYEHMAIRKLNNCGNEIVMFHEGFDNTALSQSQRSNPGKLVFKQHTLIGTKLGAIEWCTAKMAQRQYRAIVAIREVASPAFDPDHAQNIEEVVSFFRDNVLDAADLERMKSVVTAWPLAQEVGQFVQDHMEFLVQCCLNQEIEKAVRHTVSLGPKPNIKLVGSDFKGSQMIPLHPTVLKETSVGGGIVADNNEISLPRIEDITDMDVDESRPSEMSAQRAQKETEKAHLKDKKARAKATRKAKKERDHAIKQAEDERRQQEVRNAELANKVANDKAFEEGRQLHQESRDAELEDNIACEQKLKAARDANKAKQRQEKQDRLAKEAASKAAIEARLVERERASKQAQQDDFSKKAAIFQKQHLEEDIEKLRLKKESEARGAAEVAERDASEATERNANEARRESKNIQIIEDQRIAVAEAQRKADEAQRVAKAESDRLAALEAQRVEDELIAAAKAQRMADDAREKARLKAAELAAREEEEAKLKAQIEKNQVAEKKAAKNAARQAQEEQKNVKLDSESQKQKVASTSSKNILQAPSGAPVPDSAFPKSFQRKVIAVTKHNNAATKVVQVRAPLKDNSAPPQIASSSEFPPLGNDKKATQSGNDQRKVLPFSNSKITGLVPKVESTSQFPSFDKQTTPSTTAEDASKTAPSYSEIAVIILTGLARPPASMEDSMAVGNVDVESVSSGRSGPKKVVVPRRLDAHQTSDAKEVMDKPRLSIDTSVTGDMSVKSTPALTTDSSPLEIAKTRMAAGKVERRNSIQFIRTRTDSRASMMQSPFGLAPTTSIPSTPVTGLDIGTPAISEKSAKTYMQPKPSTPLTGINLPTPAASEKPAKKGYKETKPSTTGGARGPLAVKPWEVASSWRQPAPASASGFDHAHPEPVFMSEEPVASAEHNESKSKGEKIKGKGKDAIVKTDYSFPDIHFGELARWADERPNDMFRTGRALRISCVSQYLLSQSQGRYPGGEIVTLTFTKAHDAGGGEGKIDFVLPVNRGGSARPRCGTVAVSARDPDMDLEYEGSLRGRDPRSPLARDLDKKLEPKERPIRRYASVSNFFKIPDRA